MQYGLPVHNELYWGPLIFRASFLRSHEGTGRRYLIGWLPGHGYKTGSWLDFDFFHALNLTLKALTYDPWPSFRVAVRGKSTAGPRVG